MRHESPSQGILRFTRMRMTFGNEKTIQTFNFDPYLK